MVEALLLFLTQVSIMLREIHSPTFHSQSGTVESAFLLPCERVRRLASLYLHSGSFQESVYLLN